MYSKFFYGGGGRGSLGVSIDNLLYEKVSIERNYKSELTGMLRLSFGRGDSFAHLEIPVSVAETLIREIDQAVGEYTASKDGLNDKRTALSNAAVHDGT